MRLDFIIVGLPRSGTTWASNLFTTDQSICWHDAMGWNLPEEMDIKPSSKQYRGISCTAAWLWEDWFNWHPAPKVILERDPKEVNESLIALGMPPMEEDAIKLFKKLKGYRIPYTELFDNPQVIWDYLLPNLPFDAERHTELVLMNIQPIERVLVPDAEFVKRAIQDLQSRLIM